MKKMTSKAFETLAVHAGERMPAADSTPVVAPIWPAVGYLYESMDDMDAVFAGTKQGYVYSRYATPTVVAFEAAIASLDSKSTEADKIIEYKISREVNEAGVRPIS